MSLHELGVGDRLLGLLALLGERRREALDELAGDADDDLARAGSRPSPRPPGARPRSCRRRPRCPRPCPTACGSGPGACGRRRGRSRGPSRRSRTRAPWRTPCRCRAPCRRRASGRRRGSRCGARNAISARHAVAAGGARHAEAARAATAARTAAIASPSPSRRVPLPWAISGRPPPRPSMLRHGALDERAGRDATRHEVVADRDEQLRLVRVEPERRSRRSAACPDVLREALERVDRLEVAAPRRRTRRPARAPPRFAARSPGFGRPPPAPPALSRCFVVAQLVLERGDPLLERVRRACARRPSAARSSASNRPSISASAAAPVTASMRRIPEPMLRSPVMTKLPICPDARQCVPPHSSWLKPSTRIVRTLSPYFSSKNASAPAACASVIVIHSTLTGRSSRTTRRGPRRSISRFSSSVRPRSNGKSNRR